MISRESEVLGIKLMLHLPENEGELRRFAADEFSYIRLLQGGLLQRQLTAARGLVLAGYPPERIQAMLDNYIYKAQRVGGKVEVDDATHPKMFCSCGKEMRCARMGVRLEVMARMGPYYKIASDLWSCYKCGTEVFLVGNTEPIAEHYQPGYREVRVDREVELMRREPRILD